MNLPGARDAALAGGDDYELLFTAAPEREAEIAALARQLAIPLTRIGAIRVGSIWRISMHRGEAIVPPSKGWQHF